MFRDNTQQAWTPVTTTLQFKNSEISALIASFGDNEDEDVDNLFKQIEIVQNTCSAPNEIVIVAGKLVETTQRWYHPKANHASLPFCDLKNEL
ncbi:hypothetical protein FQR65_LT13388 [Abscondita terminalis]|nr:hypothetical protein FQR65_LT13388 [Abscondita terminalis]